MEGKQLLYQIKNYTKTALNLNSNNKYNKYGTVHFIFHSIKPIAFGLHKPTLTISGT